MRAICKTRGDNPFGQRQGLGEATPLAHIGLYDTEDVRFDMSVEFRIAKEVFARRDGTARLCSERLPFRDRPVGRQRFLDPAKAKIGIGAPVVLRGDDPSLG